MDLRSLIITPQLLKLIAEIDEFKGEWRVLHNLNPDRLQSLRRVATIESIGSSTRIEGAQLSDEQVETLLGGLSTKSFVTRDEQEVAGYAQAMETIFENHAEIQLTENHIKQLHDMLLRHSTKDERHRGEYKKHSNSIEAFDESGKSLGVVFETTTPFDTPREMRELTDWTKESLEDGSIHPLIAIAVFNVVFLAIHPFQDGNGRLSRVLVTLLLLKSHYSYIPYSSLESIIEKNKDSYYLALRRTQKTLGDEKPDWIPWLQFFLNSLKRQKDHLAQKISDSPSISSLPPESQAILQYVREHKRITTSEAEKLTGIAKTTVKRRLNQLIDQGFLVAHGKGRGSWYGADAGNKKKALDSLHSIIPMDTGDNQSSVELLQESRKRRRQQLLDNISEEGS